MILNVRDLAVANARIIMLKSRCDYLRKRVANPHKTAQVKAEIECMETRIIELNQQLKYYHKLVSGSCSDIKNPIQRIPLDQIPRQLIAERIKAGLSQSDLADAIQTSRQIIARYERTLYASASLKRIIQIDAMIKLWKNTH